MPDVFIVGVGCTPLGKHLDKSVKQLTAMAVNAALADAGCGVTAIQAAWFSNTRQGIFEGQHGIRGQVALRPLGLEGIPVFNTDNACASSTAALNLAWAYIQAQLCEVALVVGTEKMNYPEQRELMFQAFKGSMDQQLADAQIRALIAQGDGLALPPGVEKDTGAHSIFMDTYAASARAHMKQYGTTQEQIAAVAAKNHTHSSLNPLAQYRTPMTVGDVLADKLVSWPLTRSMCAPISDGSGAIVLCSESALKAFDRKRAVRIRATQITTGVKRDPQDDAQHVSALAVRRAFDQAGIGPKDISVAEVHDATAFSEIKQVEMLGLCEPGAGGRMAQSGESALGGRVPVNTSGGLLSKGHPIGATGAIQIHELVLQLRGEAGARQVAGARIAAAENGGGFYDGEEAVAAVTILERP
ncbi:MAG: thiolase family protein [Betaproteobacteria bacterium]|nr:thiolase family protein [Betaproteobacteria bacterium]